MMVNEKEFDSRFNFFVNRKDLDFLKKIGDKSGVSSAEVIRGWIREARKKKI